MRFILLITLFASYLTSFSQLTVSITSSTNVSCFGLCDGTVIASATGGVGSYTYQWDDPLSQTTSFAVSLCAGTYQVIVTDSIGATDTASVIINQNPALIATASTLTDVSCFGLWDGTATVIVSGGAGGSYTYSWNSVPVQSTQNVGNLFVGIWWVVVTDSNGCTAVDTVVITQPSPITTTVTTTDDTCGLCVGTANALVFGGTPSYTYSWSPQGAWLQVVTGLCAGNYSLTVTDANGCIDYTPVTINYGAGFSCQMGTINGTVYNDVNTNCVQNLLENGLANVMLQATPGPYYAITDSNGAYSFVIPYGTYTITQVAQPNYDEICPVAGSYSLVLDSINNTLNNNDFADTIPPIQDVSVLLSSTNIAPGFNCVYYLSYTSISNTPISGTVYLLSPDTLTFSYASVPPNLISGDTLFWNYSNLQQFETRYISATFQVPAQVGLIGDTLQACAQISPITGDATPINNSICYDKVVVGSFDPNDKQVAPKGMGSTGDILLTDNKLTYTIRFQNTGTASAVNIVVKDTLSANLDVTSLRNIFASHPFTYNVSGQGILTFTFNNIMLPDSNANEPESHGLIQFTINQHPSNGIGTVIENTAEIYFDFNPAIVTNTTTNTIVTITSVEESEVGLHPINVYPNPSNGKVSIAFKLEKSKNVSIKIVDIIGKTIKEIPQKRISKGQYKKEIDLSLLNQGVYFMSIQIGTELETRKIIIQ